MNERSDPRLRIPRSGAAARPHPSPALPRALLALAFALPFALPAAADGPPRPLSPASPEVMRFQEVTHLYAVYTRDAKPERVTRDALYGLLNDRFPGAPDGELAPFLAATDGVTLGLKRESGTFPVEFLDDFGRGLTDADRAVFEAPTAVIVTGVTGGSNDPRARRAAAMVAWAVARETGGAIFDVATLECFGEAAFRAVRLDGAGPAARDHVIVRISRDGDGRPRLATRGMRKFGRPDIALEGLAEGEIDAGMHLMRALAGRLAAPDPGETRGSAIVLSGKDLLDMLSAGAVTASPILPGRTFEILLLPARRGDSDDANRLVRAVGPALDTASAIRGAAGVFDITRPVTGFFEAGKIDRLAASVRERIPGLLERMPLRGDEELYLLVNPDIGPESAALVWVRVLSAPATDRILGIVQPRSIHPLVSPGDHLTFPLHRCYDFAVMKEGRVVEGDTVRRSLYGSGE